MSYIVVTFVRYHLRYIVFATSGGSLLDPSDISFYMEHKESPPPMRETSMRAQSAFNTRTNATHARALNMYMLSFDLTSLFSTPAH